MLDVKLIYKKKKEREKKKEEEEKNKLHTPCFCAFDVHTVHIAFKKIA